MPLRILIVGRLGRCTSMYVMTPVEGLSGVNNDMSIAYVGFLVCMRICGTVGAWTVLNRYFTSVPVAVARVTVSLSRLLGSSMTTSVCPGW